MFCKNCGSQIDDKAVACPHCGVATDNFYIHRGMAPAYNDAPSGGFAALCFFFPVIGLILYVLWHDTMPLRARSCGKGAIAGVIVAVVLVIILVVLMVVIELTMEPGMYFYCY